MNIQSMKGLGDNIYQRAFIKNAGQDVYLDTPWPELYHDLPHVHFVQPQTKLRTQAKNVRRNRMMKWERMPRGPLRSIRYGAEGIYAGMAKSFGWQAAPMDLPDFGPSPVNGQYIVVRPVTVRAEWAAQARNPLPEYVAEAARLARERGFRVISVADIEPGKEWALDPMPNYDIAFHSGELSVSELLALVQCAAGVIGGIGWIVPAGMASGTPTLAICGGQGGYNHPQKLTQGWQAVGNVAFCEPDHLCMCTQRDHSCSKLISGFTEKAARWLDEIAKGI